MAKTIGRNTNVNDAATLPVAFSVTTTLSLKISESNASRIFFCVNNNGSSDAIWIKLQAASVDNDKKGIYVEAGKSWIMTPDNIYTGEISSISDNTTTDVYITEY